VPDPILSVALLHRRSFCKLVVCSLGLAGCSIFDSKTDSKQTATGNGLPPLRPPPGAMQLDVGYVEWPADDTRLGPDLWKFVDEIGPVENPEARDRLRQNGFRVGVVGANPPTVLQRMIGMKSDFAFEPAAEEAKQISGRSFMMLSGAESDVQVSTSYPVCTLKLNHAKDPGPRTYYNAICKYRIRAYRIQDGWVKLEFTPQIHHGDEHSRHEFGENGWVLQTGKIIENFRPEQFSLQLKTGEMALVTCAEHSEGALGDLFFRGPAALRKGRDRQSVDPMFGIEQPDPNQEPEYPIQRLLLVRLVGMDQLPSKR
jgi:hypothetical protein